jgi:hypothetical protein
MHFIISINNMPNIENGRGNSNTSNTTVNPKGFEVMKDPWFHVWKIDTQTLNRFSNFWINIKNWKDKNDEGVVILNWDGKFNAYFSKGGAFEDEEISWGVVVVDKWTLKLSTYWLRHDWFGNPNAPLRVMLENKDGTTKYIIFEKK